MWSNDFTNIPTNMELLIGATYYDGIQYTLFRLLKNENGEIFLFDENNNLNKENFLQTIQAWKRVEDVPIELLGLEETL